MSFERYLVKTFIEPIKALRVFMANMTGSLLNGVEFDDIQTTYPSTTVEIYAYSLQGTLQATVEVTYSDSTKLNLVRARRV